VSSLFAKNKETVDFREKAPYTTSMSRVFVTAAIVILVVAMLLTGYDIVGHQLGLPSVLGVLLSLWPDIGTTVSDNKGWVLAIISGLVVALLLIRFPKFGRF
jgi:hypothetical protein